MAAWLAGGTALALALVQVLLPRIAASRISSRVGRYGTVESVHVSAWPAVTLLWGSADSVTVRAGHLKLSPEQTAQLLWEARGASTMEVTASSLQEGPLRLGDAILHKHGEALTAQARMTAAEVRAALPEGLDVKLLSSEHGEVRVRASGALFSVKTSVDAVAGAIDGRLIAHPLGILLSGLRLTLFSDPHVHVEGVGASIDGRRPRVYELTMRASLR
jgi:hypothetical protein